MSNRIPMKPDDCYGSKICPLSKSILNRLSIILSSSSTMSVINTNVLKRDPNIIPHFATIALETWLSDHHTEFLTAEDVKGMTSDKLLEFLTLLTQKDPESFAYLTQKIFTFYGYEEQFLNEW